MRRMYLNDGTQAWFDCDQAEVFEEDLQSDGKNFISVATESQFEHENLYRTKGGKWVKNCWSQWQGSIGGNYGISLEDAVLWLDKNGYEREAEKYDDCGILESYEI